MNHKSQGGMFVAGILLLAMIPVGSQAQDKPDAAFYLAEDQVVKPGFIEEYEATARQVAELFAQHDFPVPYMTYSTDDHHYYFLWPVDGFSGVDRLFESWYELLNKWGAEKWAALWEKWGKTIEYTDYQLIRFDPKLSYVPEAPSAIEDEAGFMYFGLCSVIPGREMEFEEIFRKFVDMFTEKEITVGWNFYSWQFGPGQPKYAYVEWGKSASDFWAHSDEIHEKWGEGMNELWNKALAAMRNYEYKTGRFRPDLSYTPKKK